MKPVFLDTSGLIAVANTDDNWHDRAEAAWRGLIESGPRSSPPRWCCLSWGMDYRESTSGPWPSISTIVYGGLTV